MPEEKETRPVEGLPMPGSGRWPGHRWDMMRQIGLIDDDGNATEKAVADYDGRQALQVEQAAAAKPAASKPAEPEEIKEIPNHENVLRIYGLGDADIGSPVSLYTVGKALAEVERLHALAGWAKRDASEAAKAAKKKQPGKDPAFRRAQQDVIDLASARSVLVALRDAVTFVLEREVRHV